MRPAAKAQGPEEYGLPCGELQHATNIGGWPSVIILDPGKQAC